MLSLWVAAILLQADHAVDTTARLDGIDVVGLVAPPTGTVAVPGGRDVDELRPGLRGCLGQRGVQAIEGRVEGLLLIQLDAEPKIVAGLLAAVVAADRVELWVADPQKPRLRGPGMDGVVGADEAGLDAAELPHILIDRVLAFLGAGVQSRDYDGRVEERFGNVDGDVHAVAQDRREGDVV